MEDQIERPKSLSNMLWFIDGLVAIDYVGELDKVHHEIQTSELEMKHKIRSDTAASFLHIIINSVNKIFVLNRDIFPCFSETL